MLVQYTWYQVRFNKYTAVAAASILYDSALGVLHVVKHTTTTPHYIVVVVVVVLTLTL